MPLDVSMFTFKRDWQDASLPVFNTFTYFNLRFATSACFGKML